MCTPLQHLAEGNSLSAYDDECEKIDLSPDGLDIDKFNRGRTFFKQNIGQCLTAMLYSLVCGLSIKRFLDVLVCTGKSSTPETSISRYLNTTLHVIKWHYGDVWDSTSKAHQSICSVRSMHRSARTLMQHSKDVSDQCDNKGDGSQIDSVYLSQYDMGLTQCGFMGAIIMYPEELGINCSLHDLDDYVYFWRWIGYLLGIDDKYNICIGGYDQAYRICKSIDTNILICSLSDPPPSFYPMARAFTDGTHLITRIPWFTVESVMVRYYQIAGKTYPYPVSITTWARVYSMRLYLSLMYYCPIFASFINSVIEKGFQCYKFS